MSKGGRDADDLHQRVRRSAHRKTAPARVGTAEPASCTKPKAVAAFCPPYASTRCGGVKARTSGAGSLQRSISTSVVAQLGPWPSFDVP